MQQSFSSRGQRLFGKGGTPPSFLRRRRCMNLVSQKPQRNDKSKSGNISVIASSTNENSKNCPSSFSERRKNVNTTNALANDAPTVEDVTSNLNAADLDKEGRTPKKRTTTTTTTKKRATNSNADGNKNSYSDTPRITMRRQQRTTHHHRRIQQHLDES